MGVTYIKSKETSQTIRVDKSDLKVYPYLYGKLLDLASYQAKSRDKLVNYSCQLMYSLVCLLTF